DLVRKSSLGGGLRPPPARIFSLGFIGPRDIHNSSWRSGIPAKSNQASNYSPTHRTEKMVQLQIEPAEPGKTDSITSRNIQVIYPKSAQIK
ncbi:hypothetical protein ARMSODRAFT_950293, partial [Armillaria solidipes]